jgi:hypothetical protein
MKLTDKNTNAIYRALRDSKDDDGEGFSSQELEALWETYLSGFASNVMNFDIRGSSMTPYGARIDATEINDPTRGE